MAIIMTQTARGSANVYGNQSREYVEGEELKTDEPWQKDLAQAFLDAGLAKETKTVKPTETKQEAAPEASSGVKQAIKKAVAPKKGKSKTSD